MKQKMSHSAVGRVGENIAVGWLKRRGFVLLIRNYRALGGELDVVMQKDGVVHCFEVKTQQHTDNFPQKGTDRYMPDMHYTVHKHRTVWRVFEAYLRHNRGGTHVPHAVHLVCVEIHPPTQKARVWVAWDV